MPNREKQENNLDKINIKRKARKSLSIPQKVNVKRSSTTQPTVVQLLSKEKITNEADASSSDTDELPDDDGWQTDTSVEQMRSSDLLSLDEICMPPRLSLSDRNELASLNFLDRDEGPIAYSTPIPFPDDDKCSVKSLSPEKSMQLPDLPDDVDVESDEKREGLTLYLKIRAPDGFFDITEDSDTPTNKDNDVEDDKYCRKNRVTSSMIKAYSRKRKQKDEVINLLKDINYSRNKEKEQDNEFDNNIPETSTHPGKTNSSRFKFTTKKSTNLKKLHKTKHKSELDKKGNSFEGALCNRVVHFEESPNLLMDTPKIEKAYSDNKMHSSNLKKKLFRRNRTKKGENLSEDKNNDNEYRFENIQNVYKRLDKVGIFYKSTDRCNMGDDFKNAPEIDTPKGNKEPHEGDEGSCSKRKKTPFRRKRANEQMYSSEGTNPNGSIDNLGNHWCTQHEEMQEDGRETCTLPKKRKKNKRFEFNKTPQNLNAETKSPSSAPLSRQKNEEENSFKNINQGDSEDDLKIVQNFQDDRDKVANSSEGNHKGEARFEDARISTNTAKKKKLYRDVRTGSKEIIKKPMNKEPNSFEDINQNNDEFTFGNAHQDKIGNSSKDKNTGEDNCEANHTNTSKKKRRAPREVGSRPQKNLRNQQNSSSLKGTEDAMKSISEGKKSNWPRCCLETMDPKSVRVLKPVIRDDIPIDSIALFCWGNESKKNCKH